MGASLPVSETHPHKLSNTSLVSVEYVDSDRLTSQINIVQFCIQKNKYLVEILYLYCHLMIGVITRRSSRWRKIK